MQRQEIEAQRMALEEQNKQVHQANKIIEAQNKQIQLKNEQLALEVDSQTQDLRKTNLELIEHNSRLEQFAYIISHNLRAPVARLVGLSTILEHTDTKDEWRKIIQMMVKSTGDLDQVIKDLSIILRIQKLSAQVLSWINLRDAVDKVTDMLETEIKDNQARVIYDFHDTCGVFSLPQYFESILYNLVSNSIKYRHPERPPVITIRAKSDCQFMQIEVIDNGLGLDLQVSKNNLFSLYKRFHFHVEGKGMGLFLVKTQVNALGGKIEVNSNVNVGTTFVIYLKKEMQG